MTFFYNEIHFRRDFVGGLVHEWVPPMDTVINDLIGHTHEKIDDSDDDITLSVQDNDGVANSDGVVGNADSTTFQVDESPHNTLNNTVDVANMSVHVPPPGHLQDRGIGMTPYSKKQVENILEVVVAGYNKFSKGQQYKVSSVVLDLQNLMCTEENTIAKSDGTIVSVPTPAQITRESKKILKPSHERRVIAA